MRRGTEELIAAGVLLAMLAVFAAVWLPLLPNEVGKVPVDYSAWLPSLLAGYFWYLHNGITWLPWFSPYECAGIPFQADPQTGYLSLPQFLAFVTDPLNAVRAAWLIYAAAGFWGVWYLARRVFAISLPAALLAASLFAMNGFFAGRMAAGHLTFGAFMLLPAVCAAVLRPPGQEVPPRSALLLRAGVCGVLVAVTIQAGMVVMLPQFYAAAAAVVILHACRFGWQWRAFAILAAGTVIALALCAAKLQAGLSLFGNFPRELYPLPGLPGLFALLYVALRSVFWPFGNPLNAWVVHSRLIQEPQEFAYGVGLAPPLLFLAAAVLTARRSGVRGFQPQRAAAALALAAILLVPLALNLYIPAWNGVLKALPLIGSSSNLLRWFAIYILPAILGAAIAIDRISGDARARRMGLSAAALALTVAGVVLSDRTAYGSNGSGIYDPADIADAWQRAHDSGQPPPVTDVVQLFAADHRTVLLEPNRQNGIAHGFSTLSCYDPLFGYRLEKLPFGKIRLGHALNVADGVVNFKNPACYVYPGANQCMPGDPFTATQVDEAARFLNYEAYDYALPAGATLARWLSLLTLIALPLVMGWAGWRLKKGKD